MAIRQYIAYTSKSRYFAGFLQNLAKESGLNASVVQQDGQIVLSVPDDDGEALDRFAQQTQRYLPHSIFLGQIKTERQNVAVVETNFHSPSYRIGLCPRCMHELTDPASERYLDDTIVCTHYGNKPETFNDPATFSPHYKEGDALLITDITALNTLFILTEDEIKALLSIERPMLKVTLKDETLKEISGKQYLYARAPYSIKSALVALNAKESEVPYLFFIPQATLRVAVLQKNVFLIKDDLGLSNPLESLHVEKILNRFLNIAKEADFGRRAIGVNLSSQNGISFIVSDQGGCREVLRFGAFALDNVLEQMKADARKSKMLQNFSKKYPDIIRELEENRDYDLFDALCIVLECKGRGFETLSDTALLFRGNGGLKIDMYFDEAGFDYASLLGSVMSFALADTQAHYLAYSIFEAFGDMVVATLNQLKAKTGIEHFVMMGDMFENSVLHSRIESKFAMYQPYFSKGFALDD